MPLPTLLIAGYGDLGARVAAGRLARGGEVVGLRRRELREPRPGLAGVRVDLATGDGMARVPRRVDAVLYCVAPDLREEAAYRALYLDGLRRLLDRVDAPRWLFVSSTAVYAQDAGEWLDEDSAAEPARFNGRVLLEAEAQALQHEGGDVLRLSGLYGPGRDALLRRAREGLASAPRWGNRIHLDDAAAAASLLLERPNGTAAPTTVASPRIVIGSDDAPARDCDVQAWLRAREDLLPVTPDAGPDTGRRLRNTRLRGLGWTPTFPDFAAGYASLAGTTPGV